MQGTPPATGAVGSSTIVYGGNVLAATGVSFNGVPALEFYNISRNYVSATVPPGATTGSITVATPNGNDVSPGSFTVE